MTMYVRHFLTQHFGRGTGTVEDTASDRYQVSVHFANAQLPRLCYAHARAHAGDAAAADGWPHERLLRLAIAQACRDLRKAAAPGAAGAAAPDLDASVPPWIGDLTPEPYGGSTLGFTRHRPHEDKRIAANGVLSRMIDLGVQKRSTEGSAAARRFLENAAIPGAIIRRVLSHARRHRHQAMPAGPVGQDGGAGEKREQ